VVEKHSTVYDLIVRKYKQDATCRKRGKVGSILPTFLASEAKATSR